MIKLFIMDVDGTLTDGMIYISRSGELMKAFNCKDGYGIARELPQHGIVPVIITTRVSDIVIRRCEEIGITELYQGVQDKFAVIEKLAEKYDAKMSEVVFIGDDSNDYPCMKSLKACGGMIGCPADSVNEIIEIADYVCRHNGGSGAVREFIDIILGLETGLSCTV